MTKKQKISNWFAKYGMLTSIALLVLALAITTVCVVGDNKTSTLSVSKANNPVVSVGAKPVEVLSFCLPMKNASVIKNFSENELYLNKTLNRWEFHNGIDFVSANNEVMAVANGQVVKISEDFENGTFVEIKHKDGLSSIYASLDENVLVSVGDFVVKGQVIAYAGKTAQNEVEDGNHLHFQMMENDKVIHPSNYLEIEIK